MGLYRESKTLAEKSLALPRVTGREGELQRAAALLDLGRSHMRLGNPKQADEAFEQALAVRIRVLGENHLVVARVLITWALCVHSLDVPAKLLPRIVAPSPSNSVPRRTTRKPMPACEGWGCCTSIKAILRGRWIRSGKLKESPGRNTGTRVRSWPIVCTT